MTSAEIRQQFLDFFKNKGHRIVPSAPVVPFDDPTLLFANAGMNQFKDVFLGLGTREYKRAADTQKCIRVSGKHNDLEEVGRDTYHHTFFEMLGNWSFGDYYKKEAIKWAWELLTVVWNLPKERLWATVYKTDNEASEFWRTETDINPSHILPFGEKDNFWEMGETGPCGPCSEIHINLSDDYENPKYVNAGVPECIEIWNLVFIQYNRNSNGELQDLPAKHVDTGMGFERICAVLQKKGSNYDTDVFTPIINEISRISGVKYDTEANKVPMRVIADHVRTLSFAIADGAVPGNDGRGYVLRRILRRAARYGRKLGLSKPFIYELVEVLSAHMSSVFPELKQKKQHIQKIIKAEEESFNVTLDRGIELFEKIAEKVTSAGSSIISGEDIFMLYDTYGFPVDLTNVMAGERNLSIDEARFNALMDEQRTRARESTKEKFASVSALINDVESFEIDESEKPEFVGYESLYVDAKIIGHKKEGNSELIILDRTPFYVESGGQISDIGWIEFPEKNRRFEVDNVSKVYNLVVHALDAAEIDFPIEKGMRVKAIVDQGRRWDIMRNHSATHLLHAALRKVLGEHVRQAGSYVGPDRLRFDFAHYSKLSEEEIKKIEAIVNEQIRKNIRHLPHRAIPFDEAKKMGALMFFGDKYGDRVNVVEFEGASMEFCGGTHVTNTAEIGMFKIISEASVASGIRRIEAVTGKGVEEFIHLQEENLKKEEEKIAQLLEEKRKLEKELAEISFKAKLGKLDAVLNSPVDLEGIRLFKGRVEASNMDELKGFGDELREKMKDAVGVLISEMDGKVGIVCVVSDGLIKEKKLAAGKIVGELAKLVGGGGGGRPHLATAGGKDVTKINEALNQANDVIKKML
ncbi:MAG: alanine--tRNA ligase [Ignavibacteria bacterium]|jgi:alanyl-tRNA synthetase|nr:alanine--tRNA ligase [Ignavibacteria bacterium]MCU7503292.1 alanine--tRNA ligase [Ignavibacteria bacterium]MCU7515762.1 alanine--tRNA ligase [Ignavibacteria bacterium]